MADENQEQPAAPMAGPSPVAARYGLVRPVQGRYLAGVCAALGRATRTDPVLWRVLLPVLSCFGGVGVLVYLGLWLTTPQEGDTASPVEAVLGRGYSTMSSVTTLLLAVLGGVVLFFIFPGPLHLLLLAGVVMLAIVLLLSQGRNSAASPGSAGTEPTPASTCASPPPEPTPGPAPFGPRPFTPSPPFGPPPPGYRSPFAPHGPFGGPPPPAPSPLPSRSRSSLGYLTFFSMLLVVALLGMVSLTGLHSVPAAGYLAGALAVLGVGLLVGAWFGRARGLIWLGVVLALALPVVHAASSWNPPEHFATSMTWTPANVPQVQDRYEITVGQGTLDLRQVDFTGQEVDVAVRVTGGDMTVLVPPEVNVSAEVQVQLGEASVFDTLIEGGGVRTVVDEVSASDPIAGVLKLDLRVKLGGIEVSR